MCLITTPTQLWLKLEMKIIKDKRTLHFYNQIVFDLSRSVSGNYEVTESFRQSLYHYLTLVENEEYTVDLNRLIEDFFYSVSYKDWTYSTYYKKLPLIEDIKTHKGLTKKQKNILCILLEEFEFFKATETFKLRKDKNHQGFKNIREYFKVTKGNSK